MASGDVTPFLLAKPTLLGTSSTLVLAPTAGYTNMTVKQIVVCNTDSIERWVRLGINTVNASDCFVFQLPIAGNDTVVLDTAITLTYLDSALYGSSDTANMVTVTVTGWRTEA
jgi:hypothetical protein